ALMPQKGGFEVCRELKGDPKTAAIPIILLSAIAQTDPTRDWAKESPADRFMAKPFQMKELLAVIESLLGLSDVGETALRRRAVLDVEPRGTVIIRPERNLQGRR